MIPQWHVRTAVFVTAWFLFGLSLSVLGGGTPEWTFQTEGPISSSPVLADDGTVYFSSSYYTSSGCTLHALDPAGNSKWEYESGSYLSPPAIGSDGTIYVGSEDRYLHAIDRNGALKWSFLTGGEIHASPAVGADGTIYVGSEDGILYAIDVQGEKKWSYAAGTNIASSPAIDFDGAIYFGSEGGILCALESDGMLRWEFTANASIQSAPVIGLDGTVYFGTVDGTFYALDPAGSQKWRFQADGPIVSAPSIGSDGTIYFGCFGGFLCALDPEGSLRWKYETHGPLISSPAIGGDGTLFFGAADNSIYAVSQDGLLLWEYQTDGCASTCSPAIGDGVVYGGSDDGSLYCLEAEGTDGSLWPMYKHDPQRTGSLSENKDVPQVEGRLPVEIAYDDGTGEESRGFSAAGMGWAVRFTPPLGGSILVGLRYYIAGLVGDSASIEVHIWDGDHHDLIIPFTITLSEEGWVDVDLSQYQLAFTEDFYAGYIQTSADFHPWIGYDMSGSSDRSYYTSDWTLALPAGSSVMVRAIMQEK